MPWQSELVNLNTTPNNERRIMGLIKKAKSMVPAKFKTANGKALNQGALKAAKGAVVSPTNFESGKLYIMENRAGNVGLFMVGDGYTGAGHIPGVHLDIELETSTAGKFTNGDVSATFYKINNSSGGKRRRGTRKATRKSRKHTRRH
jgi:hypothetical protein